MENQNKTENINQQQEQVTAFQGNGRKDKDSVLKYLMSVKSDSSINQGFNLILSECTEYFDKKYLAYQKENDNKSTVAFVEDQNGEQIKFNTRSEIFKHCCEVSISLIDKTFKEPMENFNVCRTQCENQYESGVINYFYRESCYKVCRKAMEFETRPLAHDVFYKNKQFHVNQELRKLD